MIEVNISYEIAAAGQEEYLLHLAPGEILSRMSSPSACALAAITEKDDGSRVPVGLMIFEISGNKDRRLVWLYVLQDYRRQGIGEGLLRYFIDYNSYGQAYVVLSDEMLADSSTEQIKAYFLEKNFADKGYDGSHFEISRQQILTCEITRKYSFLFKRYEKVKPFIDLDRDETEKAIAGFSNYNMGRLLYEKAVKDVSCVYRDSSNVLGIIVVGKEDGIYRFLTMWAPNPRIERMLFEASILKLDRVMTGSDKLLVDDENPSIFGWVEKLFENVKRKKQIHMALQ